MTNFIPINECIDACVAAGQVPDYRNFGEAAMATNTMDYRHLYIVHMPQGKFLPAGFNGASALALSVTPPHLVWYNWSAMNPPSSHLNQAMFPDYNYRQMAAQAWAHEIMHHLESPWPSGACDSSSQGYSGWIYNFGGDCGGSTTFTAPDVVLDFEHYQEHLWSQNPIGVIWMANVLLLLLVILGLVNLQHNQAVQSSGVTYSKRWMTWTMAPQPP